MKKNVMLLLAFACTMFTFSAMSQKYKTAADTIKLNKEWVKISNDIAETQAKLIVAQNNLPNYNKKADDATADAKKAAAESSNQANKVTGENVKDAKKAKKKANKALNDAEDAKDAENDVKDQEKKISKLNNELQKKQEKLQKLDEMRTAIRNQAN